MQEHVLSRVSDAVLLRDLAALIAKDRLTIARILAHLAEVDARRLYAPAGYPSMHAFCVGELRFSEDAAYKRIQAARAARRFPALFAAVAGGRLHLAAVCLLAPHLTAENVEELVQTATHRHKSQVEAFLARRFSVPGMPAPVRFCRRPPAGRFPNWPRGRLRKAVQATPNLPRGKWRTRKPRRERPRPSVIDFTSRSGKPHMTSSATPRPCSATPFPRGIRPRCSTAPWRL